jgi:hypothetical protein
MSDFVTCVDRSVKGLCWWSECRNYLPKRKRRFCSNRCATFFNMNHSWNTAVVWAIKFAQGMCERCKRFDADYEGCYPSASEGRAVRGLRLEVNHIFPLNGATGTMTCRNHQMNLQVLCHECHVHVTKLQRNAGLIGKRLDASHPIKKRGFQAIGRNDVANIYSR